MIFQLDILFVLFFDFRCHAAKHGGPPPKAQSGKPGNQRYFQALSLEKIMKQTMSLNSQPNTKKHGKPFWPVSARNLYPYLWNRTCIVWITWGSGSLKISAPCCTPAPMFSMNGNWGGSFRGIARTPPSCRRYAIPLPYLKLNWPQGTTNKRWTSSVNISHCG